MNKSLTEMTAEIITSQAGHVKMHAEEMVEAVGKVFQALRNAQQAEQGTEATAREEEAGGILARPGRSVFRNHVICLECGRKFKQLGDRHLISHGLNKRTYKEKWGIPRAKKLVATATSDRRRKMAEERGLGDILAEARRKRFEGLKPKSMFVAPPAEVTTPKAKAKVKKIGKGKAKAHVKAAQAAGAADPAAETAPETVE